MKYLIYLITLCFAFSALAEVNYPVKNFKYISDWDYREEVQDSSKYVVMVFSSKNCLERTIVDRSCFLFEKKLDYYIPGFSSKVKVVGFNTFFENYTVVSQFHITKIPTEIILKNDQIIKQMEASYLTYNIMTGRQVWQDKLLKEVVSTVSQIR
jgi:hypothetical protein